MSSEEKETKSTDIYKRDIYLRYEDPCLLPEIRRICPEDKNFRHVNPEEIKCYQEEKEYAKDEEPYIVLMAKKLDIKRTNFLAFCLLYFSKMGDDEIELFIYPYFKHFLKEFTRFQDNKYSHFDLTKVNDPTPIFKDWKAKKPSKFSSHPFYVYKMARFTIKIKRSIYNAFDQRRKEIIKNKKFSYEYGHYKKCRKVEICEKRSSIACLKCPSKNIEWTEYDMQNTTSQLINAIVTFMKEFEIIKKEGITKDNFSERYSFLSKEKTEELGCPQLYINDWERDENFRLVEKEDSVLKNSDDNYETMQNRVHDIIINNSILKCIEEKISEKECKELLIKKHKINNIDDEKFRTLKKSLTQDLRDLMKKFKKGEISEPELDNRLKEKKINISNDEYNQLQSRLI